MKRVVIVGIFVALALTRANAQINAGEQQPEPSLPFKMVQVATLDLPWRIAFLPDGRMLITEKVGGLWLVTPAGSQDAGRERSGRSLEGAGRHAGRLSLAALCQGPQRLPDLFGAGRADGSSLALARAS